MTNIRALTVATAIATVAVPLSAASAHASGGTAVTRHGTCAGGGATYTLKAKHDNGLIEVEWQVDSNRAGQVWTVRLRDNGELFFSGHRTTQAPSGSFTVRRSTRNRAGSDTIRARSVHGQTDCLARVTL
jgi:hypothetical protein